MLVLSRRVDDEIRINDDITIRVLKIKGNTVRLGISAPSDVNIMRGELPQREFEFTLPDEFDSETPPEIRFQPRSVPTLRNRMSDFASRSDRAT